MGCVIAAKRPQRDGIPNAITMPWKPSQAPYTRPGQFAGKLGIKFDPLYVYGNRKKTTEFKAPDLVLSSDVPSKRLFSRQELLTQFDAARRDLDQISAVKSWNGQQERALSLLASSRALDAFDVAKESPETLARYGDSVNSMSLLAARRLVEMVSRSLRSSGRKKTNSFPRSATVAAAGIRTGTTLPASRKTCCPNLTQGFRL